MFLNQSPIRNVAENAAYPHGTSKRIPLQKGHLILIDTGGSLDGYQSDISRTFPFGEYSEWQEDMWNTVQKAQKAALEAIKLGNPIEEIDKAARRVVEEAGYGSDYETFTHRLGHGIGLQVLSPFLSFPFLSFPFYFISFSFSFFFCCSFLKVRSLTFLNRTRVMKRSMQ